MTMYAVGNLPDHVTRYNHKNQNRWMVMTRPPERLSGWDILSRAATVIGFVSCGAGLITVAAFVLQVV